ncbi:general stress protein A [Devosia pacifica]|uniref:General stress protein A n=1 Tax=Devosia pacifica TaxID=1335967 RepID=A0A918VTL9_9HYPH|nr:glycosyltransferase family 8 protein [Devosia pacifica]GHA22157.1 general stress protein A [Devosia pacifica]
MKPVQAIHVALAFDDNFWAPAFAVMRSVCLNTTRRRDLVFHLCHEGLAEKRYAALDKIAEEFGATLVHHRLAESDRFRAMRERLPVARRLHPVIYARLLLDRLLPEGTPRVIYLDCDTMMMGPIERLWQMDLDGKALAAVEDPWRLFNMNGRDLREKRDIFDPALPYFNSGMLVIDLEKFARANIAGHLAEFERKGYLNRLYYDQDMLNLIFRGNWKRLDWRYNVVDPRMAHQAMDPFLLHFTGEVRPWSLTAGMLQSVAFGRLYRHVMTNAVFYAFWRERLLRGFKRLNPFAGK